MARLLDRPVTVVMAAGRPLRFRHGSVLREVALVLEEWREVGDWWEEEVEYHVFRVQTRDGGVYELTQDGRNGSWRLTRAYD